MPSKKIYAPFIDGKRALCSRCFSALKPIEKYGRDEDGLWFIASCSRCGSRMRWYRKDDGTPETPDAEEEENAFSFRIENGEVVMKTEE